MGWLKIFSLLLKTVAETTPKQPAQKKNEGNDSDGGYLGYYGLREWYDSQPKAVQKFLYKSCGYGINTNSKSLTTGNIISIGSPDDEYPCTATTFLCDHAITALRERNHDVFHALMEKARDSISSAADREYYIAIKTRTMEEMAYYPDQKKINAAKPSIRKKIRDNPGLLQTDLKKWFPAGEENVFGIAYSQVLEEGKIRREKKGRTFQLYLD